MSLLAVEGEICKNSETTLESVMGTWNSWVNNNCAFSTLLPNVGNRLVSISVFKAIISLITWIDSFDVSIFRRK